MKLTCACLFVLLTAASGAASSVPFDDLDGAIVVSASIDGKGPFHMILDSGASTTVITPELAVQIGVTSGEAVTTHGMGNDAVRTRATVLGSVAIGGARADQVSAVIVPLPPGLTYQGDYGTIYGLVGYSFLSHFATTFDFTRHVASFARPSTFVAPADSAGVPIEVSSHVPIVQASVDGVPGKFEIDSGNDGTLILAPDFVAEHDVAAYYVHVFPEEYEGVGGTQHSTLVRLKSFSVAGIALHDAVTALSEAKAGVLRGSDLAGNIGYDIIRRFTLTLDYVSGRAYFEPNATLTDEKPYLVTGIVSERRADGTFSVRSIIRGTPAARAGIESGAIILSVDGMSVTHMDNGQYARLLRGSGGRAVTLELRSGPIQREVTLTPAIEL